MIQLDEGSELSFPVAGDESELPQDTLDRLRRTGIDLAETSPVVSRQLMKQTLVEFGQPSEPTLAAYKQFVDREIAGIPVLGSRFVLTYTPDFTLKKVLGYWPTMARNGHQLSSSLSPKEVADLVAQQLVDDGQTDVSGSIPLRYVYVANASGTKIRLDLHVEAMLLEPSGEDDQGEHVEKTRVLLIDVPAA